MKKSRGLTLAEVLISTSIAAIVGSLLMVIVTNSSGLFYKESSQVNMGLNTNDALAQIRKSIKQSGAVVPLFATDSQTYTSGEKQLVLKVPSLDSSGNATIGVFDHFVFFLDETKLHFKIFPDILSSRKSQDQIFSTNTDNLLFQYFNLENPPAEVTPAIAAKVKITLTLKEKNGTVYEINIATSEANLRND